MKNILKMVKEAYKLKKLTFKGLNQVFCRESTYLIQPLRTAIRVFLALLPCDICQSMILFFVKAMSGIGPFGVSLTFFFFTVITVSGLLTPPLPFGITINLPWYKYRFFLEHPIYLSRRMLKPKMAAAR